MTRQRMHIFEQIRASDGHPTAEDVYERVRCILPHISLGTVYRNLDCLVEMGLIRKIDTAGHARRYDGNMEPHDHVRCTRCGAIGDVPSRHIECERKRVQVPGFRIDNVHTEYEGVCDACASK